MKNLLFALLLLLTVPTWAATFPVTDTFSGSGPLSSNWTSTTSALGYVPLQQATGQAIPSAAGQQGLAIYTGATFSNDQFAQVKFVAHLASSNSSTGPCVRMNVAGDGVCYLAEVGQIYLLVAGGGVSTVAAGCPIPSSGDTIQIAVVGTTYTCTDITTGASASGSDSTDTTGSPGILVDQRPSTIYALANFHADCTPTCGGTGPSAVITFAPPSGTYATAQMVTITTTISGATLFYTTDGSTPTTASTVYNGSILVAASETLRAIAVASASAAYTINQPVASAVDFSPPGGSFTSTQKVTLTSDTPSATIYYTTDGSNPNTASNVFTGPITVSTSETIKAIAVASGFGTSPVTSETYSISSAGGQTWYVNGVGGTRFSVNQPNGQCDGLSPNAYPGGGVNQHCAFNDIRYLWTDGSYTTDTNAGSPSWGWIGASGDTYLVDCTGNAHCRIGQSGPNSGDGFGLAGNPFGSGAPPPLNGTPNAHTRIFGINHDSCRLPSARAHVNGGFGVSAVFNFTGSSNVDFACFDITDFSSCGRAGQVHACKTDLPLDDFATNGIQLNNKTTNTTITDVSVHGMASAGMIGATGNGVSVTRVTVAGNASSGWNMDDGSGATGTGLLNVSFFNVLWNGCAEEYPITHLLPYSDCTDDNSGGYGDGVGTATTTSNPSWFMFVDHSIAANNTQDGFDLLHLEGGGSTMTITNSLMYGNMGQQLKMGAAGTAINNLIVGNCNALRQAIPGTPAGYNTRLSDYCRAADVPVVISVSDGGLTTRYLYNTLYSANTIGVEVTTNGPCTTTCFLDYDNNIFLGFQNNTQTGYPGGGNLQFPNPIFFDAAQILSSSGSEFTNNATFNFRGNWTCPETPFNEQNAVCADPGLVDETFHVYGFGNMEPAVPSSPVVGHALPLPFITKDFGGRPRSATTPTIGALEGRLP